VSIRSHVVVSKQGDELIDCKLNCDELDAATRRDHFIRKSRAVRPLPLRQTNEPTNNPFIIIIIIIIITLH
jgi:hypothetical protein